MESEFCKLEIFLPESHLEAVQQALWSVDAGHIGRYDWLSLLQPCHRRLAPPGGHRPLSGQDG